MFPSSSHACKFILFLFALTPALVNAQGRSGSANKSGGVSSSEATFLEMKRIQAEMDVTEKEVVYYNKELRKKRKEREKMNDKAHRLEYKVARTLNRIDTTQAHRPTYAEWQLEKARRARDHAALYIANTEAVRREKIIMLGDKAKEFTQAKAEFHRSASADNIDVRRSRNPQKAHHRQKRQKILE